MDNTLVGQSDHFRKDHRIFSSYPVLLLRLTEELSDGNTVVADSFGDHQWIDTAKLKLCGGRCPSNALNSSNNAFAFMVKKTPTDMEITFQSYCLKHDVIKALAEVKLEGSEQNGLLLLKHRSLLSHKLNQMRQGRISGPEWDFRVAALSLLVDGLLNCPQVYQSYGFHYLHEQGYLKLDEQEWFSDDKRHAIRVNSLLDQLTDAHNDNSDKATAPHMFYIDCCLLDAEIQPCPAMLADPKKTPPAVAKVSNFPTGRSISEIMPNSHAQLLLMAIRSGCIRRTRLLLCHGYDVNCEFGGETPLSTGIVYGFDSLVQLLLAYGADVLAAALILQNKSAVDPSLRDRINSLSQPGPSQTAQKTSQRKTKLAQLRNNFWAEYEKISHIWKSKWGKSRRRPEHFDIEKGVLSAWGTALATMRALCQGRSPRSAREVLMFLAMTKAMIPILDSDGRKGLENEFLHDVSRWRLLFSDSIHDPLEEEKLIAAVGEVWGVDITKARMHPSQDYNQLGEPLLQVQDFTLRLFKEASRTVSVASPDDPDLCNVQRLKQAREDFSSIRSLATSFPQIIQDGACSSATQIRPSFNNLGNKDTISLPGESSSSQAPQSVLDCALLVVLAGTIFAIVLAFLLMLRSSTYTSIIDDLFPPTATSSMVIRADVATCKETSILNRTSKILELFLGISTLSTHSFTRANIREGSGRENIDRPIPTASDEVPRCSIPASIPLSSAIGLSRGTNSFTELESSPRSAPTEKKVFCDKCNKTFSNSSNLGKHNNDKHYKVRYACDFCGKDYQRNWTRERHQKRKHPESDPPSQRSLA